MIREHEFNTRWWGAPVGVVDDPAFFDATAAARAEALRPYVWSEFGVQDAAPALRLAAHRAGFISADSYVQFRIDLRPFAGLSFPAGLAVRVPGEGTTNWEPTGLKPFEHERFALLAGCTQDRLTSRYSRWAGELARAHPETSLEFVFDGEVCGWFLSRAGKTGLELTLAMSTQSARLPGAELYRQALGEFARRGHRLGNAGFSLRNRSVHNIYASLGARFTGVRDFFLWQPTPQS